MTVQVLHSGMTGAPTITGQSGTLASMLKACLVDGFGLVTLDSLAVAGGIATATRAAGHSQTVGAAVTIAGATPGGLNGAKTVLTATTNTFTFDATGISDQTATGTITAKVSPLGWAREYNGTNLEVFRSADVAGTRHYLRVDDSGAEPREARVVSYETMSDANTGSNPSPTAAQVSGGGFWTKSTSASGTTRAWVLAGDGRTFYLSVAFGGTTAYATVGFGDFESFKGSDAYANFIQVATATQVAVSPGTTGFDIDYMDTESTPTFGLYLSRSYTAIGSSAVAARGHAFSMSATSVVHRSGSAATGWQYPNGPDGGLYLSRPYILEATSKAIRGRFRGFHVTPQAVGAATIALLEKVTGVTGLSGRTLAAVQSATGTFFYDATGPW